MRGSRLHSSCLSELGVTLRSVGSISRIQQCSSNAKMRCCSRCRSHLGRGDVEHILLAEIHGFTVTDYVVDLGVRESDHS
jgi:hypothetical protein